MKSPSTAVAPTPDSLFIARGARLLLPSGAEGVFVRWKSRHINPANRVEGMERVAVVQLEGGSEHDEFSEPFMRRCRVLGGGT